MIHPHIKGLYHIVLIESDWNLKLRYELQNFIISRSINRIRLEFKECKLFSVCDISYGINRIRLEFKVCMDYKSIGGIFMY